MAIDTTAVKGILSTIRAGNGFKNVATPSVSKLTDIKIPSVAELANLAESQISSGAEAPTIEALTEARNLILASQQQALSFSTHVSNISGVSLLGEPNFVTMAKTAQAAREINGNNTCEAVFQIFGAVQNAAAITANINKFADLVKDFLENIPARIDDIVRNATALTAALAMQIVSDTEAYAKAKLTVLEYSVASNLTSLFDDQCVGAVLATIMTDPLKAEVTKASEALKSKLAMSIGGYSRSTPISGGSSSIPGGGGGGSDYTIYISNTRKSSADSEYHVWRDWNDITPVGVDPGKPSRMFTMFASILPKFWTPGLPYSNLSKANFVDRLRFSFGAGWRGWNISTIGTYDITFPTKDNETNGDATITSVIGTGLWYNGPAIETKYIFPKDFGRRATPPNIAPADGSWSLNHLYYSSDFPDSRFMFVGSSSSEVTSGSVGVFYELRKGEWENNTISVLPRYPVINNYGPHGNDNSLGPIYYLYPNYDVTQYNPFIVGGGIVYNEGILIPEHATTLSTWSPYNWVYFEIKAL